MKKIIFLYLEGCPYCHNAIKAMNELKAENPDYAKLEITYIEEEQQPEKAKKYAKYYYYVPTMFVNDEKLYEAHPGESYDECRSHVAKVFATAYK